MAWGLVAAPCLTKGAWAAEAQQVTVAVSARNSLYHLPLVLAERLGFFRQRGLQVELLWCDSGAQALASLQSGESQVLAGAFERLFELQLQGQYHQAFAQMTRTPMVSLGVTTRWPARSPAPPTASPRGRPSSRCGCSGAPRRRRWLR